MASGDDKYDRRITMSSTYTPPLPRNWGKRPRRWPTQLAITIVLLGAAVVGGVLGLEHWLGLDRRLPRIWRVTDYYPKVVTRVVAASGEPIGEIVGERRTVLPAEPRALQEAVVQAREPDYFIRQRLSRMDVVRAAVRRVRGEEEPPSIALSLARSLTRELPDREWLRFGKEWLVALRLERRLSRDEVLHLYMNEVSFAGGVFGVEEGARAHLKLGAAQLDARQAATLVSHAESDAAIANAPTPPRAPEQVAAVEAELSARYEPDGLARLGATVTTTCDLALTQKIRELVRARKLNATVVVQKSESHEVSALVGSLDARPIGGMRVPIVLAAALRSQKFSAATVVDAESGERLRSLLLRNPLRAADLLIDRGLSLPAVLELAANAGLPRDLDGTALVVGRAPVTPLAVSSMLATFASSGVRRKPQLVSNIGGEPESEALRASFKAISPEEAYRVASLLPLGGRAGRVAGLSAGGWFVAFTPELAVTVHVDGSERTRISAAELERLASSLGTAVLAAAQKGPPRGFVRPAGLSIEE